VVPLLNGLAHLDVLDAAFGQHRVMGGSCQIFATLSADGVVKSMGDIQAILFGARDHSAAQRDATATLAHWYGKTNVTWTASDNIMQDMWEKLVFLSTFAGMTSLMRANIGEILATADGKSLMQRYVDATIAIARAEGFPPRANKIERFTNVLNSVGSTTTASMLRDIEAQSQVEADHIVGYMLAKARQHGIDDTLLSVAYTHLKAYENRRAAARL
jgi:2-dehydropantoate 2-reductase